MEDKKQIKISFKMFLIITIVAILIVAICAIIVYGKKAGIGIKDITMYELQTSEYFRYTPDSYKYKITNEKELEDFYSLFSNRINIDVNKLKGHTIFIETRVAGSGSIKHKLEKVTYDNNTVNFVIKTNSPQIGTCDMAFWYFVAIIPNDNIKNLKLDDWSTPSEVLKEIRMRYYLEIEFNDKKDIADISQKMAQVSEKGTLKGNYNSGSGRYYMETYDKNTAELIKNKFMQYNNVKNVKITEDRANEYEYEDFLKKLNNNYSIEYGIEVELDYFGGAFDNTLKAVKECFDFEEVREAGFSVFFNDKDIPITKLTESIDKMKDIPYYEHIKDYKISISHNYNR